MKRVKRYQEGGTTSVDSSLSTLGYSNQMGTPGQTAGASQGIDQISQGMDTVNNAMSTVSNAIYGGSGANLNVGGFKKGGMVSSASKRGDGCAIKGKTRGRMV